MFVRTYAVCVAAAAVVVVDGDMRQMDAGHDERTNGMRARSSCPIVRMYSGTVLHSFPALDSLHVDSSRETRRVREGDQKEEEVFAACTLVPHSPLVSIIALNA